MGVGMGMLPMLNSERVVAATGGVAKRFIAITWTNGIVPDDFYPPAGALTAALPAILAPLEMWKSKVLSIRGKGTKTNTGGIDSKVMLSSNAFGGHSAYPTLLTGSMRGATASIDNLINDSFKTAGYASPPLTLGLRPGSSSTSWKAGGVKNSSETDPYRLYTRLFAGIPANPPPAGMPATPMADPLLARRKSVIDKLKPDLMNFAAKLGKDDQAKVNAHLDSIRSIELQLTAGPTVAVGAGCRPPANTPAGLTFGNNNQNFPDQFKLMTDIMAASVKCDLARTMTLDLIDDGGGNSLTFPTLNLSSPDYHAIAHKGSASYAQKTQIDAMFYKYVANLVGQLAANPEGGSTSLDNTVILCCNDMNEGSNHYVASLPYLVIGSGGGFFKQGTCVQLAANAPNNQLLTSICHAMGMTVAGVGDAAYTGDLDSVLKA
jgi:hypothetical protein